MNIYILIDKTDELQSQYEFGSFNDLECDFYAKIEHDKKILSLYGLTDFSKLYDNYIVYMVKKSQNGSRIVTKKFTYDTTNDKFKEINPKPIRSNVCGIECDVKKKPAVTRMENSDSDDTYVPTGRVSRKDSVSSLDSYVMDFCGGYNSDDRDTRIDKLLKDYGVPNRSPQQTPNLKDLEGNSVLDTREGHHGNSPDVSNDHVSDSCDTSDHDTDIEKEFEEAEKEFNSKETHTEEEMMEMMDLMDTFQTIKKERLEKLQKKTSSQCDTSSVTDENYRITKERIFKELNDQQHRTFACDLFCHKIFTDNGTKLDTVPEWKRIIFFVISKISYLYDISMCKSQTDIDNMIKEGKLNIEEIFESFKKIYNDVKNSFSYYDERSDPYKVIV